MFNIIPTAFGRDLISYDPFKDFDRFFAAPAVKSAVAFRTDIRHEDGTYTVEADLPGVAKEDIDLEIKDEVLTIKAVRHSEQENEEKKGSYIRCERSWGSYERSFDVSGIDTDNISAAFENGVLKLTLPEKKAVEPEVRKLSIA